MLVIPPSVVVEQTKSNSKNNRRSFDSFRAQRETSLRMTRVMWVMECG
jgi:hypothetical protein